MDLLIRISACTFYLKDRVQHLKKAMGSDSKWMPYDYELFMEKLCEETLSRTEKLSMNETWLFRDGLFQRGQKLGGSEDMRWYESVWNMNSLCGTLQYTMWEMVNTDLNKGVTPRSEHMKIMQQHMRGTQPETSEAQWGQPSDVLKHVSVVFKTVLSFYRESLSFFNDVRITPENLTSVSAFQEHQATLLFIFGYLQNIAYNWPDPVDPTEPTQPTQPTEPTHLEIHDNTKGFLAYCREGLDSQMECTHAQHPLYAMFGTAIYASKRLQFMVNTNIPMSSVRKERDAAKKMNTAVTQMRASIGTCDKQIPYNARMHATFEKQHLVLIQDFRDKLLAVYAASIGGLSGVFKDLDHSQIVTWGPRYLQCQCILMSVCKRVSKIQYDSEKEP